MTTVATRLRAIADLEGFDIQVMQADVPVDPTANGVLGSYPFEKKQKGSKTIAEWHRDRFERTYPTFWCRVFDGNGSEVARHTRLSTLRETYEAED